jgi:UDP-glucose 4-epimerase
VEAGYQVVVLDNLVHGHRDTVDSMQGAELIVGDIADQGLLRRLFRLHDISAVFHFSAYAYVGESVLNPSKYYQNNVAATLNLLDVMLEFGVHHFVFSSSCATYGIPCEVPITEDQPQVPINPYGASKLMVERILRDYDHAYGLKSVIFRYFNAAGADSRMRSGERHDPETHIIPLMLQAAAGETDSVSIFGSDYPTPDGTCIRDFIHVTDLAQAHLMGLDYLTQHHRSECFNLGGENGASILELLEVARRVTGRNIPVAYASRRDGDPPMLVGCSDKAKRVLGWSPEYSDLETIVAHAWQYYQVRVGEPTETPRPEGS